MSKPFPAKKDRDSTVAQRYQAVLAAPYNARINELEAALRVARIELLGLDSYTNVTGTLRVIAKALGEI